ncbi:hypothetical protein Cva_01564 [Caedimonas varicaedens]|uniref:Uncharacterized protein n=1 Tax=Caedimonas varicaedens TaxID=1629334 RepID=A0A0K8MG63_9PROT|nr:hypothetical protein Cva_01564 [Caedimonas varicaedens]
MFNHSFEFSCQITVRYDDNADHVILPIFIYSFGRGMNHSTEIR